MAACLAEATTCFNSRAHVGRDAGEEHRSEVVLHVSIHAPTWGATRPECLSRFRRIEVSIHAPTWGATPAPRRRSRSSTCFNSRAHVGRDRRPLRRSQGMARFQFTRPRGARRAPSSRPIPPLRFQFTRPRGARLAVHPQPAHPRAVSIHAPTWGATGADELAGVEVGVSIHAPTWGATTDGARFGFPAGFNSRAHVGRDALRSRVRNILEVSIHAPTWGATEYAAFLDKFKPFQFTRPRGARPSRSDAPNATSCFNSRAHVGRDFRRDGAEVWFAQFQFTRPRGARRPSAARIGTAISGFQFTRPRGARRNRRRASR